MRRLVLYIPDELNTRIDRVRARGRWSRSEVGKLLLEAALRDVDEVIPDGWIEHLLGQNGGGPKTEGREHERK